MPDYYFLPNQTIPRKLEYLYLYNTFLQYFSKLSRTVLEIIASKVSTFNMESVHVGNAHTYVRTYLWLDHVLLYKGRMKSDNFPKN